MIRRFINDEGGATAIEYGLIASLVFIVIINAVNAVADANSENYDKISTAVAGA